MSGPAKIYETVLIVPMTVEVKEKLKEKAGRLNMAEVVRKLINQYLLDEKENEQ